LEKTRFAKQQQTRALGIAAASFFATKSKKDIAKSPTPKGNAQIKFMTLLIYEI
jgi:hypothetical protein